MHELELESNIRLFAVVVYPIRMGNFWVSDFLMISVWTNLSHPYLRQVFSNAKFLFSSIPYLLFHFISLGNSPLKLGEAAKQLGLSQGSVTFKNSVSASFFFYSVTFITSIKKMFFLLLHHFGDFTQNEKVLNRRGFQFQLYSGHGQTFLVCMSNKENKQQVNNRVFLFPSL